MFPQQPIPRRLFARVFWTCYVDYCLRWLDSLRGTDNSHDATRYSANKKCHSKRMLKYLLEYIFHFQYLHKIILHNSECFCRELKNIMLSSFEASETRWMASSVWELCWLRGRFRSEIWDDNSRGRWILCWVCRVFLELAEGFCMSMFVSKI